MARYDRRRHDARGSFENGVGQNGLYGRVTLHNPSEIPDNYVIFINGEQASKADVLRLAPQKIKRMEVLRGKEAAKEYGAGSEGVIKITTRR